MKLYNSWAVLPKLATEPSLIIVLVYTGPSSLARLALYKLLQQRNVS